ncbi:hypothetical protein [Marisediminicola antarctica]|uniref:Uncharacterized protein n=1 Tax=Marisediminicola antarctica TaxID=674079 RepID=A0A7L5AH97_9MICO|nr:hypothetical protein [Marisediminicola antarctica]QHO69938.1 hypothetical protein BHD05_10050 [Marisediminicola antarctica]
MSDRDLPPAALEITDYRRALESAANSSRVVPVGVTAFAIATAALVAALVFLGQGTALGGESLAAVVAVGIAGTGVLCALFVVLPLQLVTRQRRRQAAEAASRQHAAAEALRLHLASIGYNVPLEVAGDWLQSPEPAATVPLVHDSVIAARWWQPAEHDERVFVEPYLREGENSSTLPVLPPLKPRE